MNRDELREYFEKWTARPSTDGVGVWPQIGQAGLALLDEIVLLEEQRGGNTTPIFWELLAERDKLKEKVEQLKKTMKDALSTANEGALTALKAKQDEIDELFDLAKKDTEESLATVLELKAQLKTTQEALEPFAVGRELGEDAPELFPVHITSLRRAKAVYEDKD